MKVFLIALGVILAVLAVPSMLFLLGSMTLETAEETYHLLVSYNIIRPRVGDSKMFEIWSMCNSIKLRRECGDCPYHTKDGCGFAGPPGEWDEEIINGKRVLWRRTIL